MGGKGKGRKSDALCLSPAGSRDRAGGKGGRRRVDEQASKSRSPGTMFCSKVGHWSAEQGASVQEGTFAETHHSQGRACPPRASP